MIKYLDNCLDDIKLKTQNMNLEEKLSYIITYYWYHILGVVAAFSLILFLIIHFGFGNKKPMFTCVLVNQEINSERDNKLKETFSKDSEIDIERIDIDSNFNISYRDKQYKGVNESSYDKFFFKWQTKELDAVILPESFYDYCKDLGGTFIDLSQLETGNLTLYNDNGVNTAIIATNTSLNPYLNKTDEKLLLVFPDITQHLEQCQKFINFIKNSSERG